MRQEMEVVPGKGFRMTVCNNKNLECTRRMRSSPICPGRCPPCIHRIHSYPRPQQKCRGYMVRVHSNRRSTGNLRRKRCNPPAPCRPPPPEGRFQAGKRLGCAHSSRLGSGTWARSRGSLWHPVRGRCGSHLGDLCRSIKRGSSS